MVSFTPGPWIAVSNPHDLCVFVYKANDLNGPHIAEIPVLMNHHEDACLIAEAPELYECLMYLMKNVRLDITEFWEMRIAQTLGRVQNACRRTRSLDSPRDQKSFQS
jgi:hypothetical protein